MDILLVSFWCTCINSVRKVLHSRRGTAALRFTGKVRQMMLCRVTADSAVVTTNGHPIGDVIYP